MFERLLSKLTNLPGAASAASAAGFGVVQPRVTASTPSTASSFSWWCAVCTCQDQNFQLNKPDKIFKQVLQKIDF